MTVGLVVASAIHRVATGQLGAIARTVLFLPQVIPLVAAGIIWGWLLARRGLLNQILSAIESCSKIMQIAQIFLSFYLRNLHNL